MDECGKCTTVSRTAALEGVMWSAPVSVTFQPTWGSWWWPLASPQNSTQTGGPAEGTL